MPARAIIQLLILLLPFMQGMAQTIRGEVLDLDDKSPLTDVKIENIYTSLEISSGAQGAFLIAAARGHLLEFNKQGYKTARVRIPDGFVPPYFRILMKKGITDIKEIKVVPNRYDPRDDSMRYRELYKHELEFAKLSTFESIAHPFSALSRQNRQIWQFQGTYEQYEQEKYVDRTFNAEIITKFTGLKGDSLTAYMRRFRPGYYQVRSMNDYAFFNYIKTTVKTFRRHDSPRSAQ